MSQTGPEVATAVLGGDGLGGGAVGRSQPAKAPAKPRPSHRPTIRRDAITGFADDLDVVLDVEEHGQTPTEQLLIVDNDHTDRLSVVLGLTVGHSWIMARTD